MIWVIAGTLLHPFLRIFGAKGSLKKTVIVFLYIVPSLHIVWVLLFGGFAAITTDVDTTLTYPYVVAFRSGIEGSQERAVPPPWYRGDILGYDELKQEEFGPDHPWDGTILPPAPTPPPQSLWGPYPDLRELKAPTRIPISSTEWPRPTVFTKLAFKDIDFGLSAFICLIAAYYLSHCWYLANGLSAAHGISRWYGFRKLLALSVVIVIGVPIALIVIFILMVIYYRYKNH